MKVRHKLNKNGFLNSIDSLNENQLDNYIDLSEIKFADIFGIVSLALLIRREYSYNNKIQLIMPNNFDVSSYLHISGFVNYVRDIADVKYNGLNIFSKLHGKIEIDSNKDYIPLQIINSGDDVELIIGKIILWLRNKGVQENEGRKIFTLLLELFGNALDHSNSGGGCAFAMQKYKSKLMISIADYGVGIKESLERNKSYVGIFDSNEDAMQHIFTNRNYISSEDEKGRGNGFFCLNNLSIEKQMEFFICSRDGFYASEYIGGRNQRKSKKIYDIKGTHVNFCINL